ncbi:MAG: CHAT domain-containing protein, partial [Planctomycetota bacterium]
MACLDRARSALTDEPLVLGSLDNNRGEALLALSDFDGAQDAFEKARSEYGRAEAPIAAAIAEGNLADLAARQGRLREALASFERARRQFELHQSPVHLARLLAEQAEAKSILGLPSDALAEYEAVLPRLEESGLALEAARARRGMGEVLLRLERPSEAETALAAAATGFEELEHGTARAKVDLVRAELLARHDRVREARQLTQRALATVVDRPADAAAARLVLARLALQDGDAATAHAELDEAAALVEPLDIAPLLADLLAVRAETHRAQGRLDAAVDDLDRAVKAVERVRGSLQAERLRVAYLGDRARIYQDLITALLQRDRTDDLERAFAIIEQAKSRSLLEQMASVLQEERVSEPDDPASSALRRLVQRQQAELNGLYSRLVDADESNAAMATLQQRVRQCEQRLDAARGRLSLTNGTAGLLAPTATLTEVQTVLSEDTLLLECMTLGDDLMLFAVTPDSLTVHRVRAALPKITQLVSHLRFQIDRALRPGAQEGPRASRLIRDARETLAGLYELVLAPVRDELTPFSRITVVPHGPLHLVPMHALWDGDRYLVETHEVTSVPSASILHRLRVAPTGERGADFVVGVADEIAPRITEEAVSVAQTLRCPVERLLLGASASAEALRGIRTAGIVHLACHGRFDPESPWSSGLRLGDRWLTVRDIYEMRIDADLVTLSGCETGVNTVTAGDELLGLLRGFFAAGARSVMASLWRADDEATAFGMTRFYDQWQTRQRRHHDASAALRAVQLQMLD